MSELLNILTNVYSYVAQIISLCLVIICCGSKEDFTDGATRNIILLAIWLWLTSM